MQMKIRNREELINFIKHCGQVEFIFFWGHQKPKTGVSKSCLSQWYDAPFEVNGIKYSTAEHYMMAEKARLFGDIDTLRKILKAKTPREAQKLGREVKGFNNEIWKRYRFKIVVNGNLEKFKQNPELKRFLLNTGNKILVEASPDDQIWGIGLLASHPAAKNPNLWKGLNLLGFALMEVRDLLRSSHI